MKTTQTLKRKMGQFEVHQRTSDCMFNATALLEQWNKSHPERKDKRLQSFWSDNKDSIYGFMLEMNEDLNSSKSGDLNSSKSCDLEVLDFQSLKKKFVASTRGKNGGTWMNPYLFIKFAMWVSPRFEYHVVKFVYDQLVQFRHDAGDNFKIIQAAITRWRPTPRHRAHLSKALNCIVFGKHGRDLRNKATEEQLQTLSFLERKYADLVNEGYIRNYNQLIEKLRVEWNDRQKPF